MQCHIRSLHWVDYTSLLLTNVKNILPKLEAKYTEPPDNAFKIVHMIDYKVSIKYDKSGAGKDYNIHFTIHGEDGNTAEKAV